MTGLIGGLLTPARSVRHVYQNETRSIDDLAEELVRRLDEEDMRNLKRQEASKILEALRKARSESPKS